MDWATATILVRPQEGLRWSLRFEEELTHMGAERALQAAVGMWTYNTSSWDRIRECVEAEPEAFLRAIRHVYHNRPRRRLVSDTSHVHDHSHVLDVRLSVLEGQPGTPPAEAPSMHGIFGGERHYHAQPGLMFDAVGFAWLHAFAMKSTKVVLDAAKDEARRRGDTYLIELDTITTCMRQPGELPCWKGSVVLLCIRKEAAPQPSHRIRAEDRADLRRVERARARGEAVARAAYISSEAAGVRLRRAAAVGEAERIAGATGVGLLASPPSRGSHSVAGGAVCLGNCPIHLGPFEDPVVTRCGHVFCLGCISRWHGPCPICRAASPMSDAPAELPVCGSSLLRLLFC